MAHRSASGESPTEAAPSSQVRNIVLLGPQGAGKTTLIEQLLVAAGVLDRVGSVDTGTTVCDSDDFEIAQRSSASLAVATMEHAGLTVNLVDTPGHPEFTGEVRAGLRAADAALFVLSALDGVDQVTAQLWQECASVEMPRAIVITHLDKRRGDFDDMVAICQRVFDEDVAPVHLPLLADNYAVAGLIDLLTQEIHDYSTGTRVIRPSDLEHGPLIETARSTLIEGIIAQSEDETLMDRYLDGETLDLQQLTSDLETAISRGHFHPVVASATTPDAFGALEILDLIASGFPTPAERPFPFVTAPDGEPIDPLADHADGRLCAEVVKTTFDPYAGQICIVRIFSGSLQPGMPVHIAGHRRRLEPTADVAHQQDSPVDREGDERIRAVHRILGPSLTSVPGATAGEIVAVTGLSRAQTGDTVSDVNRPLRMDPWLIPEPELSVAIVAVQQTNEGRLSSALAHLLAEDPTIRVDIDHETGQRVLWCMGDRHLAALVSRLKTRYSCAVEAVPVRVGLRETIASSATGHGRIVKQSGGHGQFAVCTVRVEPLPRGTGYEFVDELPSGVIPRQFVASIDDGIQRAMQSGLAAGFPVVDIRVIVTDGKSHPVDSCDTAFALAGELALRDAARSAGVTLLEPTDELRIITADEYVGALISDLTSRRSRVTGTQPIDGGQTLITAIAPTAELSRYAIDLRALTHGTASFDRERRGLEPVPATVAQRLQAQNGT